jgi:hypothetical protein
MIEVSVPTRVGCSRTSVCAIMPPRDAPTTWADSMPSASRTPAAPTSDDIAAGALERFCYRLAGVHPDQGMTWRTYAVAMLTFNLVGVLAV